MAKIQGMPDSSGELSFLYSRIENMYERVCQAPILYVRKTCFCLQFRAEMIQSKKCSLSCFLVVITVKLNLGMFCHLS